MLYINSVHYVNLIKFLGQSYSIPFQYGIVEDYPMDLYYLMDLSKSMETHKMTVSALGNNLAAAMKNVTRNFRLGFGSFVDKIELPFVNIEPEKWVISNKFYVIIKLVKYIRIISKFTYLTQYWLITNYIPVILNCSGY